MSWKFYSDPVFPIGDIMRAIKNVRYTDLVEQRRRIRLVPRRHHEGEPGAGLVGESAGALQRAPDPAEPDPERLRGRELDRPDDERAPEQPVLEVHRGDRGLGRLRRLLRPRAAPAVRHHGPRRAHPRADHVALHDPRGQPARRRGRSPHLRVLLGARVHRAALRRRPADGARRPGGPAHRRVRLLATTGHAQADPAAPSGLPLRHRAALPAPGQPAAAHRDPVGVLLRGRPSRASPRSTCRPPTRRPAPGRRPGSRTAWGDRGWASVARTTPSPCARAGRRRSRSRDRAT